MAYIPASKTREIKKRLKAAFPDFKFSVRNRHHLSVTVTILAGPVTFKTLPKYCHESYVDRGYDQINHYYLEHYENAEILKEMVEIINDGNHDNSDIQTDYFDVGWYVHLEAGDWDKPYELTGGKTNGVEKIS